MSGIRLIVTDKDYHDDSKSGSTVELGSSSSSKSDSTVDLDHSSSSKSGSTVDMGHTTSSKSGSTVDMGHSSSSSSVTDSNSGSTVELGHISSSKSSVAVDLGHTSKRVSTVEFGHNSSVTDDTSISTDSTFDYGHNVYRHRENKKTDSKKSRTADSSSASEKKDNHRHRPRPNKCDTPLILAPPHPTEDAPHYDYDISHYNCPTLSDAGWDNLAKANIVLAGIATNIVEEKPRLQWTPLVCDTPPHVLEHTHTSYHQHDADDEKLNDDDEKAIVDKEVSNAYKLRFIQSSVGVFLDSINASKDRYAIIASLKANILPKEQSFGLLDNAIFDVEPLREMPPLNSFQKKLIDDAYAMIDGDVSEEVAEIGRYYHTIRPAHIFLEEGTAKIQELCKHAAKEDLSHLHTAFKEIFDHAISISRDAVFAWADRRDLTEDDRDVYRLVDKACIQFSVSRGSEMPDDLAKALHSAKAAIAFIHADRERAERNELHVRKLGAFVENYACLYELASKPVKTQALFTQLSIIAQLTAISEIEKAIAKISCSEEGKKDSALKEAAKEMIREHSFLDKMSKVPAFIIDLAQLSIDTQIKEVGRFAKYRKIENNKILEVSLLIAATNFIDCFKAGGENDSTGQRKIHTDMLDNDFNAYRIFCTGTSRLTSNLQPYDDDTDLTESLYRAIYQTFQAGMAGRLSTICLNNTPESTIEKDNEARRHLFYMLRSLMEFYMHKMNEQYFHNDCTLKKKEIAVHKTAKHAAALAEGVNTLKAKLLLSQKKLQQNAQNRREVELDTEALEHAESDAHNARHAAETAASEYHAAVRAYKNPVCYPYEILPIVTKNTGLKILSNALRSNALNGGIFQSDSELTHLLDNLASCPDNLDYIYDAMGKIAQWVRGDNDNSEIVPATAKHVERLGRAIIRKIEALSPHTCDSNDKKDICSSVHALSECVMSAISALSDKIESIDRKLKGLHMNNDLIRDIHKILHKTNHHHAGPSNMTILPDA